MPSSALEPQVTVFQARPLIRLVWLLRVCLVFFFPGKLDIHNILVALPVNEQIPLRIAHYLLWGYDSLVLTGQDKVLIQESCVSLCVTVSITLEACSRLQVQGPF